MALWQRSLELLRSQFEQASFRSPDLRITWIEADDGHRDRLLEHLPINESDGECYRFESTMIGAPARFVELTPEEAQATAADPEAVLLRETPDKSSPPIAKLRRSSLC